MKILVIGSLNMDTTFRLHHLPKKGETILSHELSQSPGGKGQNQGVAAARLGAFVQILGGLGSDAFGERIRQRLLKDGISTEYLLTKEVGTGRASIYVDPQGNNTIVVYPGANFTITPEDLATNIEAFKDVSHVVLQLEIPLPVVYRALEIAKEMNITTLLNPAPANPNFDFQYLKYVDYFIPNETELELILGRSISTEEEMVEGARVLLNRGCKNIIITLGENGSLLINERERRWIPSKKVSSIDTTAAGDSYIGAFVYGLNRGQSPLEAMEFATEVAAITVTKEGAIDSLPYGSELEDLYEKDTH